MSCWMQMHSTMFIIIIAVALSIMYVYYIHRCCLLSTYLHNAILAAAKYYGRKQFTVYYGLRKVTLFKMSINALLTGQGIWKRLYMAVNYRTVFCEFVCVFFSSSSRCLRCYAAPARECSLLRRPIVDRKFIERWNTQVLWIWNFRRVVSDSEHCGGSWVWASELYVGCAAEIVAKYEGLYIAFAVCLFACGWVEHVPSWSSVLP